jgi:predicted DNA-binding transcriptional regulator YafY
MDTLLRYFEMLYLIPREPSSISTLELLEKLQNTGYQIDLRTVQRDLIKLSSSHLFPICSTEGTRPLRWFWQDNSDRLQFPMMSTDEALTFKLVEMFLDPLLPPAVKFHITDYFQLADKKLKTSPLASWIDKVRIIPNSLALLPAEIPQKIVAIVYDALFKNRRFNATYQAIDKPSKNYEVNPLGLVFRHNLVYLVATINDYSDIKQLALHRFQSAELSEREVVVPAGFNLDSYIAQGEFDYPLDDETDHIALKLKINGFIKQLLSETPLSTDQRITEFGEEFFMLAATVKNTQQLRWWIRSFGSNIEVLEPLALREEFAADIKLLSQVYN